MLHLKKLVSALLLEINFICKFAHEFRKGQKCELGYRSRVNKNTKKTQQLVSYREVDRNQEKHGALTCIRNLCSGSQVLPRIDRCSMYTALCGLSQMQIPSEIF